MCERLSTDKASSQMICGANYKRAPFFGFFRVAEHTGPHTSCEDAMSAKL